MTAPRLNELTATEVAHRLARGETTARAVIEACLEQVARREAEVLAFAHLDAEGARAAADALDRRSDPPPLAGAGLGVKDIIDTADMPTGYGSPIHQGHQPSADAACVALMRKAGAIVLGKTVTTEFANIHPGPTRNPHDATRTPGGSSSGSAAAVAAMMVPLALGTQTTSSTIRPASFCGVVGFVPSLGEIPLSGVRTAAQSFDRIGVFARSVVDIALAYDALRGVPVAAAPKPFAPRIGYCRGHMVERMDPGTAERMDALALHLSHAGAVVSDVAVGATIAELSHTHQAISSFEFLRNFTYEIEHHWSRISTTLREGRNPHGRACSHAAYRASLQQATHARAGIDGLFEGQDVLLAAAAAGEAPQGSATGDFQFCAIWTVLGLPALSLPLMTGPNGLPIGAQLLARPGDEAKLLAAAEWMMGHGTG